MSEAALTDSRLQDIVATFRADGFVVVKNIFSHALIDRIQREVLAVADEGQIANAIRDIHRAPDGEISSMHNLVDYVPGYRELMTYRPVLEIFNALYGEKSDAVFNSSYFAKPKSVGYETKPHQDNAFFCLTPPEVVTCWFPVEFADHRNGALYYYRGSWKSGNIPHQPQGNLGASMCLGDADVAKVAAQYEKVPVPLTKGDCVIHGAQVVHGSDANTSDFNRRAFNFSLASKNARRDEALFAQYQERLKLFLEAKKQAAQ